jgi:asparagine synthase (glutamine-hydrolysing)
MCGICGVVQKDSRPVDRDVLGRMCRTLIHRGPDEEGFYWGDGVGLGIRRLKIIDLETGRQPIHNEDETVWVVFNGEIYNYRELRQDLEARGHRFSTRSDTEVIVHLYEEIGEATPTRLNGMFCFAVWDARRQRLFIARDRLGIKQLYFYEDAGQFVFGSEIKAVLAHPAVPRNLDPAAVRDYFSFLYVPSPRTIYGDIRQQPPATWTTLDRQGARSERYWSLAYRPRIRDEAEAVERTVECLRDSVRYRLISDVPLGAYLSGGIDSGIIVALMASLSSKPVETFTIIWEHEGAAFDERAHAREVARRHGANHHEIPVSPDVSGVLDDVIASFDAPFADASAIPN